MSTALLPSTSTSHEVAGTGTSLAPGPAETSTLTDDIRNRGALGFLTGRIDVKIIGPYVIVMLLLAGLATFVTTRLLTDQLGQRFENQLLDAGKNANSSVIKIEQEQLELLRLMAATEGVDAGIVNGDAVALQKLLVPLEADSVFTIVDVFNTSGREVLAIRPASGPLARATDPNASQWDITKEAVSGVADQFGDKYSDITRTSFGDIFYTGGPVKDDNGKVVGAILVGMPFSDFLQRLTRDVGANLTIYGSDGRPVATSLSTAVNDPALPIDAGTFQKVTDPKAQVSLQRQLQIGGQDYMELLGQLFVGHNKVAGGLGVEVQTPAIAQAAANTKTQMTVLFGVVLIMVLGLGYLLAQSITRPILILVKACQLVASGDFGQKVQVKARDETGVLADSFNQMVTGLKDRDLIRDTFGKYMSEAVSNAILSGDLKLGGERKSVTVMITHIRWSGSRPFASLYESMEAEDLVAFLNSYFHSMVDAIVRYEGIVDKFVGDEILAVFGAPIKHDDDARRGVLAALEMRRRMVEFNRILEEGGHEPIRIGVGLYSGPVVSGNIGSEVRMEYTVIGDTVNCTARTEELTKEYKTDILVGDTTYELVKDYFDFGDPFFTTLRGRTQQTALYPVFGLKEEFEELVSDQGPVLVSSSSGMTQEMIDAALAAAT